MNNGQLNKRILELEQKWMNNTIGEEEKAEYAQWYNSFDDEAPIDIPAALATDSEMHQAKILSAINKTIAKSSPAAKIINRKQWIWAAAAVFMLAIGSGIYYFNNQSYKSNKSPQITVKTNDIMPGGNRATLTVGNKTIELNSNKEGIVNNGNQLTYSDGSAISETLHNLALTTYTSLTTPRGGQYQLTLPDGTNVWLNAATTIDFPVTFNGKERKVKLSGEAYFEVNKNITQPFKVISRNGMEIEVLGTSFNINAYADEPVQSATLLTGKVKITRGKQSVFLHPAEQVIDKNESTDALKIIKNVDTESIIAWKEGVFSLKNIDLKTLVRQLSRWYDIETEVAKDVTFPDIKIGGSISRENPLSDIIVALREYGIDARMQNNKMMIYPSMKNQ